MRNPFQPGDTKHYRTSVTADKLAYFAQEGLVHPVYSTFALAHDAEWVCRLFVLQMKEAGEEGIGSYVSVRHKSPAPEGTAVELIATLAWVVDNRIGCNYQAYAGERLIAEGEQEQHIVDKAKFDRTLAKFNPGSGAEGSS
jgi:predicted thioesterase